MSVVRGCWWGRRSALVTRVWPELIHIVSASRRLSQTRPWAFLGTTSHGRWGALPRTFWRSEVPLVVADLEHRWSEQACRDALVLNVREGGRVVPVHALVATGVNADGHREILGIPRTS